MTGEFAGGSGTELDPYLIETPQQLQNIGLSDYIAGGYYFRLISDIDLTGFTWTHVNGFVGSINGNGKKISNLNSLFISANTGSSISNIWFSNCNLPAIATINGSYFIYNRGDISNCIFDTIIMGNAPNQCAVIQNYNTVHDCIFRNCSVRVTFDNAYSAGICGMILRSEGTTYNVLSVGNSSYCNNTRTVNIATGASLFLCDSFKTTINAHDNAIVSGTLGSYGSGTILAPTAVWYVYGGGGSTSNITNTYYANNISIIRGGSGNGINGTAVTESDMHLQGFYDGTGISGTTYLSWDFVNTWYWDSTDNLPKLRVFNPSTPSMKIRCKVGGAWKNITSVKTKVGGTWKNVDSAKTKSGGTWKRV